MNTLFALLAEYETAQIPLGRCAQLFGLTADEAARRAVRQALPIPAYRAGSQKSPWLVDAAALAEYLDQRKCQARENWMKVRGLHNGSATKCT